MENDLKIINDSILQRYHTTLTENIYKDQNGYLVCEGCVLGRTGTQQYTEYELGISKTTKIVDVYRLEKYVFDSASMLSLEGRPLTLKHPKELVNAENHALYAKGEVFNVRRVDDNIIGDIRVFDPKVIKLILDKDMRELSLGYTQKLAYDEQQGIYYFTDIVYNHIALVKKGRAGNAIIKDSFIEDEIDEDAFRDILSETLKPLMEDIETLKAEKNSEERKEVIDMPNENEQVKIEIEQPVEHLEVPNIEELKVKKEETPSVEEVKEQNVAPNATTANKLSEEDLNEITNRLASLLSSQKPTTETIVEKPLETTKVDLGTTEPTRETDYEKNLNNELFSYQKLQGESMEQYLNRINSNVVQSKTLKRQYQESLGN